VENISSPRKSNEEMRGVVKHHPNRSQVWKAVADKIKETIEVSRGERGRRGG